MLVLLALLALFLLGALGVLSAVSWYLAIHPSAYLTEPEVFAMIQRQRHPHAHAAPNLTHTHTHEKVPRILHQTWRTEVLPERWRGVSEGCRDLMPD